MYVRVVPDPVNRKTTFGVSRTHIMYFQYLRDPVENESLRTTLFEG